MKNWNGRNEFTETSGRLHPLWPQNKWLHTPRTDKTRQDKIHEYRRNWLSHMQRMPQNRIPLKSYHYRPQGRRTIGRPKKRWREQQYRWRRNGSNGPILDVYDDDIYIYIYISTRKENNWKTEETLARAAVTLETKRIKGSNHWSLWWWWWWRRNYVSEMLTVSCQYTDNCGLNGCS